MTGPLHLTQLTDVKNIIRYHGIHMNTPHINPLSSHPGLAAAEQRFASIPEAPTPSPTPTEAASAPATPTPAPSSSEPPTYPGRRLGMLLGLIVLLLVGHRVVWHYNDSVPFVMSDKLVHQGPWYRRAALAPVDWFKSRGYIVEHDFLGRKQVRYTVGEREFLQTVSGEPAVEVIPQP